MQNDRGVYWFLQPANSVNVRYDNAEAARKAARIYQAANLVAPKLFKMDPVKGPIEIMI